jgi:REP element-mobilizing transposase RayT
MPRKPRFAPPGHYLHITQRGNYGQRTFYSKGDHALFLELLTRTAANYNIDVLAYC